MERIQVVKGDITKIRADAIVNAANTSLLGGGGVDGAIHRIGGSEILEACRKIVARQGGCKTGEAVITTAGRLPAKFVIHTVGPVWNGGHKNEEKLLTACYKNALKLAVENDCKTVSFPGISTGIYRFPKELSAKIAVKTVGEYLEQHSEMEQVIFVCYEEDYYMMILKEVEFLLLQRVNRNSK